MNLAPFWIVLILPLSFPAAYFLGQISGFPNAFAALPLLVTEVLLPLGDWLLGLDPRNPSPDQERRWRTGRLTYVLPAVCGVLHLLLLGFGAWVLLVSGPFNWAGAILWTLGLGHFGAILAINTAHELIHRPSRLARHFGGLLLSTVGYGTFKVEHLRGHHADVATPRDPSSAPLGESFYHFLPRAIAGNLRKAWQLEAARLARARLSPWHWRNELLWWSGLSVVWMSCCGALGGLGGVAFFLAQALAAIVTLEIINYVEHYGLRRRLLPNGRYERPGLAHSWNSAHRLSNAMLLNLARHADHHANPGRNYALLRHQKDSPQLPAGYSSMLQLALIPPLWRRVMDPRVASLAS